MTEEEREFIGLFWGEGSIVFIERKSSPKSKRRGWKPSFQIHMREDERSLLEHFQKMFGGSLINKKGRLRYISKGTRIENPLIENPSCYWIVHRRDECIRIISLLEQSVLPSNKKKQVQIIKRLIEMRPQKKGKTKFGDRYTDDQLIEQEKLNQELKSSRIFKSS